MLPFAYARQRIQAILKEIGEQIGELADSDFPYDHSRDALTLLEELFQERLDAIEHLDEENVEFAETACSESLLQVFKYLPLLGFILRSTNVRNSFEIFGPLLRLARQVLGVDTKLIVSSEWSFSPHVYNPFRDLPNFVLLGLPASESGNPMLVPLAGHELGHTTWQSRGLEHDFGITVSQKIEEQVRTHKEEYSKLFGGDLNDLFVKQNLEPAYFWAMRQAEESFCDFFGMRLFAESYLSAFAYVLAPGCGQRSLLYPSLCDRVANLVKASTKVGIKPPDGFCNWFAAEAMPTRNEKESFLLTLADTTRMSLVDELIEKADEIANSSNVPKRSDENVEAVLRAFELLTPVSSVGNLTDILIAAWRAFDMQDLWQGVVDDRIETLGELVLKSIEILEFEERTKDL